ncbi:WD repeat protein [Aspergillus undulatus]|uniref:WD repeat protein n=1 Tax=Aspergillus undulatus TaxID=1810928 RepID=UPI003CCC909D
MRMWDLRDVQPDRGVAVCGSTHSYNGNSDAIRDIRWSPVDGVLVAAATDSGAIQLWDVRKSTSPLMRITAHDRPCYSVDWHPNGKHLVSGGTDRQVKVWDFSTNAERRQKPLSHFRAPQAVLNVRWRPPSWSSEMEGSGDWQSSQVVTSYDKEDPRVHLWDFRRPHIPFRELNRYDSTATDLLWHSKDLLWTVGDGGVFTQTDIRYAPQVVNQRPTCSVAWNPSGEVLAFSQKRLRRSTLGLSTNEFIGHTEEKGINGETPSQSPPDEAVLDEPLFASIRPRHSKSSSIRTSKSFGSTPPAAADLVPILPLERMVSKTTSSALCQRGMVVNIPGATLDRETFQYLARQYSPLFHDKLSITQKTPLLPLLGSLSRNAQCADDFSLPKLAQTWRVVEYAIVQELQARQRAQQKLPGKGTRTIKKSSLDDSRPEKLRQLEDTKHEKMRSRFFKGVTESEAPKNALSDFESTSNMPTPIVQPLPDSRPGSFDSTNSQLNALEDADDIHPLPPSVLSSNQGTMASTEWSSMSDIDSRPIQQLQHRESNDSENVPIFSDGAPLDRRDSMPTEIEEVGDEPRSAPLAISGRTDWHNRGRPQLMKQISDVDEFDQKMEDKKAAIRDFKYFPKRPLSLEAHAGSAKPGFYRHESTESFPMFSASTTSSHPSKSPGTSFTSAARLHDSTAVTEYGHRLASRNETLIRARSDSIITTSSIPEEELEEMLAEGPIGHGHIHVDRPSTPTSLLKESTPLKSPSQEDQGQSTLPAAVDGASSYSINEYADSLPHISIPLLSDQSNNNPWSAENLLREAIRHYHSSSNVDIQSAAHLLQKLHILFDDSENILPNEESQTIFKAYNESLIRQSMYIEAAELRSLCFPSYPAVYEYATGDTSMNVYCFTCKKPYENPKNDNSRCHRCSTPQDPCSICMSLDPPPEWVIEQSASPLETSHEQDLDAAANLTLSHSSLQTESFPPSELQRLDGTSPEIYQDARPKGTTLWTWCQGCGHGGHLACINTWLKDIEISEGGCASPGCMHDCGPGPRRDHNRRILLEESKRRDTASRKAGVGFVKRDTWAKTESKAVEQVRGMLGGAGAGTVTPGAGAGPGAGIGAGIPKGSASTTATTTANPSVGPSAASSNLMSSPKKVRLVTPSEQERPLRTATGSNRTSFG